MSKIVKKVARVVKKVAKKVVAPIGSAALSYFAGPLIGGLAGALFSTQGKSEGSSDNSALIAAKRRAEVDLLQKSKVVEAEKVKAEGEQDDLAQKLAAQKRAVAARRSKRGGLSFKGPDTGLKDKLGG